VIPDVKERLLKVIDDPHFGNRERQLTRSSLQRINELESQINTHWTQMASTALATERQTKVISEQAAIEIEGFLERHRK
jgi:hypothetical protein